MKITNKAVLDSMNIAIDLGEPDVIIAHTYDTYESGLIKGVELGIGITAAVGTAIIFVVKFIKSKANRKEMNSDETK